MRPAFPMNRPGLLPGLLFVAILLPRSSAEAQSTCPIRPSYALLRQDEDYRYLRDRSCRQDFWDPVKYAPLNAEGSRYLTIGGEIRDRYEGFRNANWGAGSQDDNGYFLQRVTLYSDWHLGRIRLFEQLTSDIEAGRKGGPRPPIDEARLWVEQGFIEVTLPRFCAKEMDLRIGRQEFEFGDGALVDVRNGPNVRQAFDGVDLVVSAGPWHFDGFATRPVRNNFNIFDDPPDHSTMFWGVYAVRPLRRIRGGNIDMFYLGFDRKRGEFEKAISQEVRHSIGTRFWGTREDWDFNWTAVYQWGSFGAGAIRAWEIDTATGRTFEGLPLRPRIALSAASASGDRNSRGWTLGTFNLFPSGIVFGEGVVDLNGPVNFIQLGTTFGLQLTKKLSLTGDYDFFWRESLNDGVYGLGVNLLRDGGTNKARFVGSQPSAGLYWQRNRHLSTSVAYAHFFVGHFLTNSLPRGRAVAYAAAWMTYKF
jgi:hypothetical protein